MIASVSLIQGCTALAHVEFSQPATVVESSFKFNDKGILELPGLGLSVLPNNLKYTSSFAGPALIVPLPVVPLGGSGDHGPEDRFRIMLKLDPREGSFSFDPGRVTLQIGETSLSPIGYSEPVVAVEYKGHHLHQYPEGHRWICQANKSSFRKEKGPIPVQSKTCITLHFDTAPPAPDQRFTLLVGGIEKNRQPFAVPSIHFQKDTDWALMTFP